MIKQKFLLLASQHDENEVRWDEDSQKWVPVVDDQGKPTFRHYRKGDIVESHVDLEQKFANKFAPYVERPAEEPIKLSEHARVAPMPEPMSSGGLPPVPADDVTAKFPKAYEADVRIRKDGDKFLIVEGNGELYNHGEKLTRRQVERLLCTLVTP